MTKAMMGLSELAEKTPDVDVRRQMIQFVAQRMMEMDAVALCGAGYDVKSPERLNSRGFRDRGRVVAFPELGGLHHHYE